MKILFVATVRSHIGQFHMPFIQCLKESGHEVHAAFKDNSEEKKGLNLSIIDKVFEIPFERSPFKFKNIEAYFRLKKVIDEGEYDIIHCHTPMGATITRLAARTARRHGAKVVYTAHGFHFYKGAPIKNWIFYYPVEKILSRNTDCLILINEEDYLLAIERNFKAKMIVKTHGVGVDLAKFDCNLTNRKTELREKFQLNPQMFGLIYPADLSIRKNQKMLLDVIAEVRKSIPTVQLLLPGQPILLDEYMSYAEKLGIQNNVKFMGYRRDIPELLAACDVAVSSSRQEGLPINIVEAMAMGKPIVATRVRGNSDLIVDQKGGFLINLNDSDAMANALLKIYELGCENNDMGKFNVKHVQNFSVNNVNVELKEIYKSLGVNFR